jgi:hypothetical protein
VVRISRVRVAVMNLVTCRKRERDTADGGQRWPNTLFNVSRQAGVGGGVQAQRLHTAHARFPFNSICYKRCNRSRVGEQEVHTCICFPFNSIYCFYVVLSLLWCFEVQSTCNPHESRRPLLACVQTRRSSLNVVPSN